jgi:hypothetical protein
MIQVHTKEESGELDSSDDKTSDVWCKTDKKPSNKSFLRTKSFNTVTEIMSSIIGDDLIQLFTEQSNLYHSENVQQGKVSPKTLK